MDVSKLVDVGLMMKQDERKDRVRSGCFSPSSLGRCYRYQYWNRKDEPVTNPVNAQTLRVFQMGHLIHDFVQGYFPKNCCEVEVSTDDVMGRADIVLDDVVIDIKSVRSYGFKVINKPDYKASDKLEHLLQVVWYAMVLGKPKAALLYVDKDSLAMKQVEVVVEKWRGKVDDELSVLRGYWNQDKTPPPLPRCYNGKECNYCGFKDKCDKLKEGG